MANFVQQEKVDVILNLLSGGHGMRFVAKEAGVAKNTVARYRDILLPNWKEIKCICGKPIGHNGFCNLRLSYCEGRVEYLKSIVVRKPRPVKSDGLVVVEKWPYWTKEKGYPDYVLAVDRLVNRNMPEQFRADVCQDILVDLLSEEITIDSVPSLLKKYVKKQYALISSKFTHVSLDDTVRGYDDLKIGDTIDSEVFRF